MTADEPGGTGEASPIKTQLDAMLERMRKSGFQVDLAALAMASDVSVGLNRLHDAVAEIMAALKVHPNIELGDAEAKLKSTTDYLQAYSSSILQMGRDLTVAIEDVKKNADG